MCLGCGYREVTFVIILWPSYDFLGLRLVHWLKLVIVGFQVFPGFPDLHIDNFICYVLPPNKLNKRTFSFFENKLLILLIDFFFAVFGAKHPLSGGSFHVDSVKL